jgi:hypothetical protein
MRDKHGVTSTQCSTMQGRGTACAFEVEGGVVIEPVHAHVRQRKHFRGTDAPPPPPNTLTAHTTPPHAHTYWYRRKHTHTGCAALTHVEAGGAPQVPGVGDVPEYGG